MTTYYVSSLIGDDRSAGTSASAPLATLQAAANLVRPGDTVEVMNGTYTAPYYGDALDITTSGTASAPIIFEAYSGQTPVIDSSGGWNAIKIEASYITVRGFTIVGDAANYTLASAMAGYSSGNSYLDGNGIAIEPTSAVPLPNHITIENNTVYNEPGGGIYTEGADYVQILNNVVHDNAHWSAFGNSGISVSTSVNLDSASGAHIVVSGNLVYNNAQLVPTDGAGIVTDGEGIILDTNPNYTAQMLVQNNTVYGNGGPGIEAYLTNGAVITGNTVYGNNTQSVQSSANAEIFINQSTGVTVTNNTLTDGTGTGGTGTGGTGSGGPIPAAPVISLAVENANHTVTVNGTGTANSTVHLYCNGGAVADIGVGSAGTWTYTSSPLLPALYEYVATDTTSGGTSAASSAYDLELSPLISKAKVNANGSVTLSGVASDGSWVRVSMGSKVLGTTTSSSSGAWSYTTSPLKAGTYTFTAIDSAAGVWSAPSAAFNVKVPSSGPSRTSASATLMSVSSDSSPASSLALAIAGAQFSSDTALNYLAPNTSVSSLLGMLANPHGNVM